MPKSLPLKIKTRTGQGRAWGGGQGGHSWAHEGKPEAESSPLDCGQAPP